MEQKQWRDDDGAMTPLVPSRYRPIAPCHHRHRAVTLSNNSSHHHVTVIARSLHRHRSIDSNLDEAM